ncbi:unnamed protein product [Caenorhabditis angaria]|uniref:Tyrosine-protein phosphatase domain-containing protein n=1 Tax=Caenorhabditis angaria TaxID=860376 RepID=A0A9P1N6J6_9PELO|nr:unnamed protein product [Caenorhabditis angaria]
MENETKAKENHDGQTEGGEPKTKTKASKGLGKRRSKTPGTEGPEALELSNPNDEGSGKKKNTKGKKKSKVEVGNRDEMACHDPTATTPIKKKEKKEKDTKKKKKKAGFFQELFFGKASNEKKSKSHTKLTPDMMTARSPAPKDKKEHEKSNEKIKEADPMTQPLTLPALTLIPSNTTSGTTSPMPEEKEMENSDVFRVLAENILLIEKNQGLSKYFQQNIMKISAKGSNYYQASPANRARNRNPDIFCVDNSRVKLKTSETDRDYIHANHIRFETLKRGYIATQHPLSTTIDDFWNMVYNQEVEVVINLTNSTGNPDEFPIYYPKEKESFMNCGQNFVSCKNVKPPKFKYAPTEYKLEVLPNGCSQSNFVSLFEYSCWGKYLVPSSPKVVVSLIKSILKIAKTNAPIVIQCETGVNQSAVVIFVDAILQHLAENNNPNIETIIQELRNQRSSTMTQRVQFLSAIHVILVFIKVRIGNLKLYAETVTKINELETSLIAEMANSMSTEVSKTTVESPRFEQIFKKVQAIWWSCAFRYNIFPMFADYWHMPVTMILGSLIAGMTAEGASAVSFPVMTLMLHLSPKIARDFAIMIQSVGMTSALVCIVFMKVKLESRTMIFSCLGAIPGFIFGIHFDFSTGKAVILVFTGFIGGIFNSFAGSGIDICVFSVATLYFRVNEKISTPTTTILKGIMSVFGFYYRAVLQADISPLSWKYFICSAPVASLTAPIGSFLGSHLHRQIIAALIYIIEIVSLIGFYASQPKLGLVFGSIVIMIFGFLIFYVISKMGERNLIERDLESKIEEMEDCSTNYTTCEKFTFLETKEFLVTSLHISSLLTVPSTIYCIYLIMRITPNKMRNVKTVLLHIQLASFLLDIMINSLGSPVLYLPAPVVSIHGIFGWLGVSIKFTAFFGQYCVYLIGMSVIALFQNRHSAIASIRFRFESKIYLCIYYAFGYLSGAIVLSLYFWEDTMTDENKLKYLETYKCPPIEYFSKNAGVLTTNLELVEICLVSLILYICLNAFYFSISTGYHLVFTNSSSVSEKTRKLQLQFLSMLIIQITIPFIALVLPTSIMIITFLTGIISQKINNFTMILYATHGIFSNFSLIFCHKPYRDHLFRIKTKVASRTISTVLVTEAL